MDSPWQFKPLFYNNLKEKVRNTYLKKLLIKMLNIQAPFSEQKQYF